jgi:hypothetical protein
LIPVNGNGHDMDGAIRELFAEPAAAEAGPDPLFVAGVMGRIARQRRLRTAAGAGMAVALLVTTFFAVPTVTASTDVVASLPLLLMAPVQDLLLSPIGFAASLPIGILLIALSTLRLTNLNS